MKGWAAATGAAGSHLPGPVTDGGDEQLLPGFEKFAHLSKLLEPGSSGVANINIDVNVLDLGIRVLQ